MKMLKKDTVGDPILGPSEFFSATAIAKTGTDKVFYGYMLA